jgi:hypothetical protein
MGIISFDLAHKQDHKEKTSITVSGDFYSEELSTLPRITHNMPVAGLEVQIHNLSSILECKDYS